MLFSIRPHRRFPVFCPATYHSGLNKGHGTVWNVSLNGWRLSGDLPLRIGQSFPMTVALQDQESVFIAAGIVRWVRGDYYGVEALIADNVALNQVGRFIKQEALTQMYGGDYGLNTFAVGTRYRSARPHIPCRPAGPNAD